MVVNSDASAKTAGRGPGVKPGPALAEDLFRAALEWLAATYPKHGFSVKREVVETLQLRLSQMVRKEGILFWRVLNGSPKQSGTRRPLSADLVIVDEPTGVLLAAEFRFEPNHKRHDISKDKLPVCTWKDIEKDCLQATEFVAQAQAAVAYAILIDEGGHFKGRTVRRGQIWSRWRGDSPDNGPWVLSCRVPPVGPAFRKT